MHDYIIQFSSLHVNKQRGQIAPHKAILLLSVMDLIASGYINSNKIEFSERLEEQFMRNWKLYVRKDSIFRPIVGTPFWHLQYESFWKLEPFIGGDKTLSELKFTNPYSSSTLRAHIRYAEIDKELFMLMQSVENRKQLRDVLISTYLSIEGGQGRNIADLVLTCICFPVLMSIGSYGSSSSLGLLAYDDFDAPPKQIQVHRTVNETMFDAKYGIIVA